MKNRATTKNRATPVGMALLSSSSWACLHLEGTPSDGVTSECLPQPRQYLDAVVHVEFERVSRHAQALDVFALQLEVGIDHVDIAGEGGL